MHSEAGTLCPSKRRRESRPVHLDSPHPVSHRALLGSHEGSEITQRVASGPNEDLYTTGRSQDSSHYHLAIVKDKYPLKNSLALLCRSVPSIIDRGNSAEYKFDWITACVGRPGMLGPLGVNEVQPLRSGVHLDSRRICRIVDQDCLMIISLRSCVRGSNPSSSVRMPLGLKVIFNSSVKTQKDRSMGLTSIFNQVDATFNIANQPPIVSKYRTATSTGGRDVRGAGFT